MSMTSETSFSLAKRMPEVCSGFHLSGCAFLFDTCQDAQLRWVLAPPVSGGAGRQTEKGNTREEGLAEAGKWQNQPRGGRDWRQENAAGDSAHGNLLTYLEGL